MSIHSLDLLRDNLIKKIPEGRSNAFYSRVKGRLETAKNTAVCVVKGRGF